MRKLKLQLQMSLDGFMAGPNGEMDWLVSDWDQPLKDYITALTQPVDCIVLGRKLAQGFIPHWASHPQLEGAAQINQAKKVVFTKTLTHTEWANTVLAQGELGDEIRALKQQAGGELIAYGGGGFVASLVQQGLIDEYHLLVNPTALGQGMPIFKCVAARHPLQLVKSTGFGCGIVALQYALKPTE